MYAYITGKVADISENAIVLECNGIGYNIFVPMSVIGRLPGIGAEVKIYTYTNVKEDALQLFGFLTKDDLGIFRLLITVNGVGPKGALSILSTLSADDLRFAIMASDAKTIAKSPGIGAKSAERIILDLKNKVDIRMPDTEGITLPQAASAQTGAQSEAVEALVALGYSPADALKAIKGIEITDDMDSGAILKLALKVIR